MVQANGSALAAKPDGIVRIHLAVNVAQQHILRIDTVFFQQAQLVHAHCALVAVGADGDARVAVYAGHCLDGALFGGGHFLKAGAQLDNTRVDLGVIQAIRHFVHQNIIQLTVGFIAKPGRHKQLLVEACAADDMHTGSLRNALIGLYVAAVVDRRHLHQGLTPGCGKTAGLLRRSRLVIQRIRDIILIRQLGFYHQVLMHIGNAQFVYI